MIGAVDLAIVLGSGLSEVLSERAPLTAVPYSEIGMPVARLAGHAGHALNGEWHGKRVLVFAGRVHGYQGFSAAEVTRNVTIAADAGATTLLLTNAAGSLTKRIRPGDLMVIEDHINLTGMNPLAGSGAENPFVNMTGAYDEDLRELAHRLDDDLCAGIYAGLLGPAYETPAEAHYLRTIGADAVGMSTVLETIAARARGMRVFGVSMITNLVAAPKTSHAEVTEAAQAAAPRMADLLEGMVRAL